MLIKDFIFRRIINIAVAIAFFAAMTQLGYPVQAAKVTTLSANLSRLQTSTLADHSIKAVLPTGLTGGMSIYLEFDADFNMGTFALANFDLAHAATCAGPFTDIPLVTGAQTHPDWRVIQTGQTVSFINSTNNISPGRCVLIEIGSNATFGGTGTTQITNPASPQVATLYYLTSEDDGRAAMSIVSGDQVSVTATVDPTISFVVSDSTIGYGTLSSSAARWANGAATGSGSEVTAHDLTASTNAPSGYTVYVVGSILTSGLNTVDAIGASATASTIGSEQFGIKVSASGGSGAAVAPYASANYAYNATTTQDDIAASVTASLPTTYSITYIGNIAITTEPGSYTTTLTYTATGFY